MKAPPAKRRAGSPPARDGQKVRQGEPTGRRERAAYRHRGAVEDQVKAAKSEGLRNPAVEHGGRLGAPEGHRIKN